MKYSILLLCSLIFLAGCGTSSKVDDFLEKADQAKIVSVTGSGEIISDRQSDELLLNSSSVQDTSDGVRGVYKDYTIELVDQAKTEGKRLVIVVYDRMDDNTVKLDQAINTSLGRIPADVMILKLDYTQAQSLYSVKNKNTVIYFDAAGTQTTLSDGGIYTMDSLLYYL